MRNVKSTISGSIKNICCPNQSRDLCLLILKGATDRSLLRLLGGFLWTAVMPRTAGNCILFLGDPEIAGADGVKCPCVPLFYVAGGCLKIHILLRELLFFLQYNQGFSFCLQLPLF